jgi:hypothetical protein
MSERHAGLYAQPMRWALFALLLSSVCSCSKDKPAETPASKPADKQCREDVGDDVAMGANTGVAGAKTGVTTAGEGLKTFGSSAAGLVEGGSDEAKKRWNDGKKDTKATANEGRAETKQEAHTPKCGGR